MFVYLFINVFVILLGLLFTKANVYIGNKRIDDRKCYFTIVAFVLVFFSAFRGDFSTDYNGYIDMYRLFESYSFESIIKRGMFDYPEKGYLLFQYAIKVIFDNPWYIFLLSSIIIIVPCLVHFKKYAAEMLLAVMLFVAGGYYYSSFNLLRQFLAVGITVIGGQYLYERKPVKYSIVILIATMFHKSAIIMLPFYFFSSMKIRKKNTLLYVFLFAIIVGVLPYAVNFAQRYYWDWYFDGNSSAAGYSWKNVVLECLLSAIAFFCYLFNKKEDDRSFLSANESVSADLTETIWLNATFLYIVFCLLGMRLKMMDRFASFFIPYMICFCCKQVHNNKYRSIILPMVIIFLVSWITIIKLDNPYYFVWS